MGGYSWMKTENQIVPGRDLGTTDHMWYTSSTLGRMLEVENIEFKHAAARHVYHKPLQVNLMLGDEN